MIRRTYRLSVLNLYAKPSYILQILRHQDQYCSHASYYPERQAKSERRILKDQIMQVLKYGYPNEFYFSYGFDVKGQSEMEQYFHLGQFKPLRDKYNISPHGSTAILRNKLYFGMFASSLGVSSPENVGVLKEGSVFDLKSKQPKTAAEYLNEIEGAFFVKLINGECGTGIFTIETQNGDIYLNSEKSSSEAVAKLAGNGTFLIQRKVGQHPQMAALHSKSLNTVRLITVKNIHTGNIEVFPSILRIGTGNSVVDNTSQGGIAVGIDTATGNLKQYGFLKPQFGGKTDTHPDSYIKFSDVAIPRWNAVKHQATLLHSMLPDIHSIGWDVAIGTNGPIFIEGNDNWEINGPQICHGGLKTMFTQYLVG